MSTIIDRLAARVRAFMAGGRTADDRPRKTWIDRRGFMLLGGRRQRNPASIRDLVSAWTKPIGEVIYVHHLIDRRLVDLIWLIEAREKALRLGRWGTKRGNPPAMTGGERICRFAELARDGLIDAEARTTIDKHVEDLNEANPFRNTLVHGRWAGHDDEQLILFDAKRAKMVHVTQEALDTRSRGAFELYLRLRDFHVWVTEQNAEVTKLLEQRRAIIRLLRARAGRSARRRAEQIARAARR